MSIGQYILLESYYAHLAEQVKRLSLTTVPVIFCGEKDIYLSIRGHADIYACCVNGYLILEPSIYTALHKRQVKHLICGGKMIGSVYPETATYNALASCDLLVHHKRLTDFQIVALCQNKTILHVNQGYTRCTTLALNANIFLTSDEGILKALRSVGKTAYFIDGKTIQLKGQAHGFIGGCCGMDINNKLWVNGNLQLHPFGPLIKDLCDDLGIEIVHLSDKPLEDIGGLLFWKQ